MKSGRLQAFSYCSSCHDIRAIREGFISYYAESTKILGRCASCGKKVTISGRRHIGPRIGADKRHLN